MIILQESLLSQEFKFIPRSYAADSMTIYDETQKTSVTIAISPLIYTYYMVVDEILDLKENRYYTLTVKNGTTTVYRDKIFCTNQTVSTYTPNEGKYVEHSSDNSFIVIQ